jgi:hypothetical protein
MAATTGLAATAAARLAIDPIWAERRDRLGRWTADRQVATGRFQGLWGYEFDVQTRWGFYAAGTPNIVATAVAAQGCLDADALDAGQQEALGAGLMRCFWRMGHFAYTPESEVLIHNANLLGAALAARLAGTKVLTAPLRHELRNAAITAAQTAISLQRHDGSWPYGEGQGLGWIDGFHTAYGLMALDQAARSAEMGVESVLKLGAEFYFRRLFSGPQPVFYPTRRDGPCDINNVATGLRAAVWGARRGYVEMGFPSRVLAHLYDRYWDQACYFRAGASRWFPAGRLDYPRWGSAPALDALTAFIAWKRERSQ